MAKNRLVRVYSVSRNGNRRLTGCLRKTGRKLVVVREYDDGYVESGAFRDVRLAGRFVAVVFDATDVSCKAACPPDYEPTQTSVVISDIRARRDRTTRTHAQTGSLRLSTAGVAAWLAPIEGGLELHAYDGGGENVLDSGAIDPASLRARRAPAHLGERGRPPQRRADALLGVPVRPEAGVDDALALRQRLDPGPLVVAQLEVEDLEVLDAALVARRLRDRAHLRLVEQPPQRDLAGGLAVRRRRSRAASGPRGPCRGRAGSRR